MTTTDQDFKYVIQNFSTIYVGGRMTYRELTTEEETPLQLKRIIQRVIKREVPLDTMLCDHLLDLSEESDSYIFFNEAKITIEVVFFYEVEKKNKKHTEYKSKTYTFGEFIKAKELHGERKDFLIREVLFKKLKLACISV